MQSPPHKDYVLDGMRNTSASPPPDSRQTEQARAEQPGSGRDGGRGGVSGYVAGY